MGKSTIGPEIERLVQLLARLPGLGPRSARKAALALIKRRTDLLEPLAAAMAVAAEKIVDLRGVRRMSIRSRRARSAAIRKRDPIADRRRRGGRRSLGARTRGRRDGALSCARRTSVAARRHRTRAIEPRRADRAGAAAVQEVLLALSATVEGQSTAHYLRDQLGAAAVTVSQLARGIPVGGELDYLDEGTLAAAIKSPAHDLALHKRTIAGSLSRSCTVGKRSMSASILAQRAASLGHATVRDRLDRAPHPGDDGHKRHRSDGDFHR